MKCTYNILKVISRNFTLTEQSDNTPYTREVYAIKLLYIIQGTKVLTCVANIISDKYLLITYFHCCRNSCVSYLRFR